MACSWDPGVRKGVFLARSSLRVLRAGPRAACPKNCMTIGCQEYGVASYWEARIKYAHWHSTVSVHKCQLNIFSVPEYHTRC